MGENNDAPPHHNELPQQVLLQPGEEAPVDNFDARRLAAISREIENWKDEPVLARAVRQPDGKTALQDPLKWWRLKKQKYHYLSQVAERLLSITATSASSERLFSSAGLTIAADRANLLPAMANELVFLHDAYALYDEITRDNA
jgi:hypothetical protein